MHLKDRTQAVSAKGTLRTAEQLAELARARQAMTQTHQAPLIDLTHISVMVGQMGHDAFAEVVEHAVDELASRVAQFQKTLRAHPVDGFAETVTYMKSLASLAGMDQLAYVLSRYAPDKIDARGCVSPAYLTRITGVADDSFRRIWDAPAFH